MPSRAPSTWSLRTTSSSAARRPGSRARAPSGPATSGNTRRPSGLRGTAPSPIRAAPTKSRAMRTSRLTIVAVAALLGGAGSACALEALPRSAAAAQTGSVTTKKFGSAVDALRSGVRDYNAGDKVGAARALEYAATQAHALALWKLGRMYADGDGVPHDDLKAFEYFSRIADENADEGPDSPNAGVIASAFTALGAYFVEGIKGTYVRPNPARAHEMFHYSASYFGDPHAQYSLAR